ncbi:hypothetical protein SAMN05720487_11015 [Fibrobacter sp. UWT2]|uniref:hypothetical protein n=1 Tax=Fibrobacter sp. UWT2 TaxID=1896224 RepID=UPI0009134E18|nr:hypothetical protein [Fibrobacter sp. UWT2]SHL23687.1 hypothetical protein SAMN05720487_11015 [Fibrobacter sp. UWT2]
MKNRMSRCAALIGTVLSLSGYAQVCNDVSLYKNGETGKMETTNMTFPEAPEWSANWGEMEALTPPYIRWSGMKDKAGDWTGMLTLNQLPVTVQGGNLTFKVRSTQKGKFGIWLMGAFGNSGVKFFNLAANKTYSLKVLVEELIGGATKTIEKIGVGLFDVPAHQYTTLFLDDIAFSCAVSGESAGTGMLYPYSDMNPKNPYREGKFLAIPTAMTTAAYSEAERLETKNSTQADFVLSEQEHRQIEEFPTRTDLTPQKSRDGWFRNMYFIDRNRLRDSVIANPKGLFYEANEVAAESDKREMPLLIGNVDYAYRMCNDSACKNVQLVNARILQAALPSASVKGSKLRVFYDPYFVSTNRNSLPRVEIYANKKWQTLEPKSEMLLEFESAGVQPVNVRLSEGGVNINQTLYVEVK